MTDIKLEDTGKGYGFGCDKNMRFRGKITKDGPGGIWLEIDEEFDIVDEVTRSKVSLSLFTIIGTRVVRKGTHTYLSPISRPIV